MYHSTKIVPHEYILLSGIHLIVTRFSAYSGRISTALAIYRLDSSRQNSSRMPMKSAGLECEAMTKSQGVTLKTRETPMIGLNTKVLPNRACFPESGTLM